MIQVRKKTTCFYIFFTPLLLCYAKTIGGGFLTHKKNKKKKTKEEGTMAATAKNYAYEVRAKEGKKIMAQPAVSKAFLEDCKKVAQKYRRRK